MTLSERVFYWPPRLLSIGFALFIGVFALDVFSEYTGFAVVLPLFIHLLPTIMLLIVALIAWRYELVGAVIFLGFAVFYVWDVGFSRPLSWYLTIVVPAGVVGVLYVTSWLQKKGHHASTGTRVEKL